VTAFAGYVGLVVGVGLIEFIAFVMRQLGVQGGYFVNPEVNFSVAMTAIALLIGVGLLAGLVPALRAARITPIEAMKAE
jgi:putative ABC transport system permease protein